jgi:hypothetical protein
MRRISSKTRKALLEEPDVCARKADGHCSGRLTWEHTLIFAGRQLDEPWAIIKLCAYHHAVDEYQDGGDLQKEKNVWLALNRATDEQLKAISKAKDYIRERERLNKIYGKR